MTEKIPMSQEEHQKRHKILHQSLDELFADYISNHGDQKEFLSMSVKELIEWSHEQTINPTHKAVITKTKK